MNINTFYAIKIGSFQTSWHLKIIQNLIQFDISFMTTEILINKQSYHRSKISIETLPLNPLNDIDNYFLLYNLNYNELIKDLKRFYDENQIHIKTGLQNIANFEIWFTEAPNDLKFFKKNLCFNKDFEFQIFFDSLILKHYNVNHQKTSFSMFLNDIKNTIIDGIERKVLVREMIIFQEFYIVGKNVSKYYGFIDNERADQLQLIFEIETHLLHDIVELFIYEFLN